MAYFQDGTQKYGIPDSPISINSVTYIAEDISITRGSTVPEIKNPDGSPQGKVIVPTNPTGTCKLQFATYTTAAPTVGMSFTLQGASYDVTSVGEKYTQGAYAYIDIAFAKHIN